MASISERSLCGFNTQPPEGGWLHGMAAVDYTAVSTHSRLKAAGLIGRLTTSPPNCFNTQPPEGGWHVRAAWSVLRCG